MGETVRDEMAGSSADSDALGLLADVNRCFALLATLFLEDPAAADHRTVREALAKADLTQEWPLGEPQELASAQQLMADASDSRLHSEWRALFLGPGHLAAPPWGSFYLDPDKVTFGKSTLELQSWFAKHGIRCIAHDESREPPDHIGRLLALTGWIAKEKPELTGECLEAHLVPWVYQYLDALERSTECRWFQGLARLTRTTLRCAQNEFEAGASIASFV